MSCRWESGSVLNHQQLQYKLINNTLTNLYPDQTTDSKKQFTIPLAGQKQITFKSDQNHFPMWSYIKYATNLQPFDLKEELTLPFVSFLQCTHTPIMND